MTKMFFPKGPTSSEIRKKYKVTHMTPDEWKKFIAAYQEEVAKQPKDEPINESNLKRFWVK